MRFGRRDDDTREEEVDHAIAHQVWRDGELTHKAAAAHPLIKAPHASELLAPQHSTAA